MSTCELQHQFPGIWCVFCCCSSFATRSDVLCIKKGLPLTNVWLFELLLPSYEFRAVWTFSYDLLEPYRCLWGKIPEGQRNYFVQYWNHIIHWFKWQKLGSVIQEEHAAASHQKDLVELVQSSIQDASWGPPRWGVLGMSHQQQASGQT